MAAFSKTAAATRSDQARAPADSAAAVSGGCALEAVAAAGMRRSIRTAKKFAPIAISKSAVKITVAVIGLEPVVGRCFTGVLTPSNAVGFQDGWKM